MEILEKILTDKVNRKKLISEFQELIWNDENASEVLSLLAYDLDFYEPNIELRKEDPSYYGDERLEEEIKLVINKLKEQNTI
jgi:GGDEF domain-containing protein